AIEKKSLSCIPKSLTYPHQKTTLFHEEPKMSSGNNPKFQNPALLAKKQALPEVPARPVKTTSKEID
ncbi:MAG: hypothetical protein WCO68_00510, partial [Verrucomicrobiota bacterium]